MSLALFFALKTYAIQGVVTHERTGEPLKDAIVILQCTCLEAARETSTNDRGQYRFGDLGPGTYTIQVLKGEADSSKVVTLPG